MIRTSNINEAKKMVQSSRERPIIIEAQSTEFNRKILEHGNFDVLFSIEANTKKDSPKYLDSGLNHVIARIAAKNKVAIGVDLGDIQKLERKEKAKRLARIKQNIKVCRKAKCKISVINCKDKRDAFALLISLGASTKQAKEAVD